MSLLASPHTVTVFDFGEIPDPRRTTICASETSLYLAMELLEGESLGARLKRRGRLPVDEAVRIARQALALARRGAREGHHPPRPQARQPLPRARAPAARGEICKVLDFGIAKILRRARRGRRARDAGGHRLRHAALHVARAGAGQAARRAQRSLLARRAPLPDAGGPPPFVDDDAVVVMARHIKTVPVPPAEAAPDAGIGAELSAAGDARPREGPRRAPPDRPGAPLRSRSRSRPPRRGSPGAPPRRPRLPPLRGPGRGARRFSTPRPPPRAPAPAPRACAAPAPSCWSA